MMICDVMTSPVITIGPDAGWPEVAERIVSARVSGLPVVGDDDRLLGVVTEADLLSHPAFGGVQHGDLAVVVEAVQGNPCWLYELVKFTAGQLMTTAVVEAHPDEDVSEAARRRGTFGEASRVEIGANRPAGRDFGPYALVHELLQDGSGGGSRVLHNTRSRHRCQLVVHWSDVVSDHGPAGT